MLRKDPGRSPIDPKRPVAPRREKPGGRPAEKPSVIPPPNTPRKPIRPAKGT